MGVSAKRGAVLVAAIAVSVALICQASRCYIAWQMGHSSDLKTQIRGAKLEGNAEAWDRLGQAYIANFDNFQPNRAAVFFERAVKLNSRSAQLWTDLALAYEEQGSISEATSAYANAVRDYPASANVAWKFGNFLLREGQTSKGLSQIQRAVSIDPKLAPLAISQIWSLEQNVNLLLHRALPHERMFYVEALNFLAASHADEAALQTWREIRSFSGPPLALQSAFPLINELIASNRANDAQNVWQQALMAAGWPESTAVKDSAVWNGGFEAPIAGGGLGWRLEQQGGDYISIDSQVRHSGKNSLRVDFTGGLNLDFAGVQQFVSVKPSTVYFFRCFMRTRSISTESGMRFEISGASVDTLTPALRGTNPWTAMSVSLTTGPTTHFLDIRLRRFPSQLFDNKLSGIVWVDDVTLTPETSVPSGSRQ